MNNSFKGIPCQKDRETRLVSLLVGRKAKEMLFAVITGFRNFSKGTLCKISPKSTRRNDKLKPGKLLNVN